MSIEKKEIIHNLSDFGKIRIKESTKSLKKKQREEFLTILNDFETISTNTDNLLASGMDPIGYEDSFYKIIEALIERVYGTRGALVIFWWLTERRENPNKKYKIIDNVTEKLHNVTTPIQLWTYVHKNLSDA